MAYTIKNLKITRLGSHTGDIYCTESNSIVGAFETSAKLDLRTRLYFTKRQFEKQFNNDAAEQGKTASEFVAELVRDAFSENGQRV